MARSDDAPAFLTTREVADLLRVKERKVYDLAAAGEIPHRRITGKLLFPRAEITAWIDGGPVAGVERPNVLTGSHDPLLDWALRESGSGLAALWNGSRAGLELFAEGGAALAGLHLPDGTGGWNVAEVAARGLRDAVLLGCASRSRGLILSHAAADAVREIGDLRGRRVVLRQPGAGSAALMQQLLERSGLTTEDLVPAAELARTENDAAAAIAAGEADAALGLAAMARRFNLPFLPMVEEHYDLVVDRRAYFTPPVQDLIRFLGGAAVRAKAAAMGGYGLDHLGTVRWLSG